MTVVPVLKSVIVRGRQSDCLKSSTLTALLALTGVAPGNGEKYTLTWVRAG